ncbi:tRNA threonylcarbamoyladenosine biosynthesis protein TsaB [Faunimonas pinastri]|uniref:N(6)-L-threonylcarbamoyladenine synthase n=1 Tax=Faunimonas pinastri TaxID=1855383 RepID=A0A1H9PQZ5_9HYPH|nr:tRNA (adenosine(37)-N6)-threonylcarbamoyltransferase complex dimerization subunit type 1 TsaB [Faunimonas pinastri]SER50500.1 tRNA threonylcarbamoyladenosine biosynthesis protein TsaB [Faunimonas pinastri]
MLLAIDTAGPDCAVAIARPGSRTGGEGRAEILARRSERIGRGHAERLMPLISECMAEAGVGFSELTAIAVTVGPGSFTGVRIGVAAARGLALALDVPAIGIDVLDAIGESARRDRPGAAVVTALDARRDEVFARARTADGAVLVESCLTRIPDLAERLAGAGRLVLNGSAAPMLAEELRERGIAAEIAPEIADERDAADIDRVVELALRGRGIVPAKPLYLRGADAKPQTGKAVARA